MNVSRCAERVAKDTEALVHDSGELLKAACRDLRDTASDAGERLQSKLETARDTCTRAKKQTRKCMHETEVLIREHPYQALAAALVAGFVGALLLAKR